MRGGLTAAVLRDPRQAAVDAALDRRLERSAGHPVAIGLSGGGDSLALLHLAADWCARAARPLLALTVDHRLHPQSPAWTARAGRMAAEAGASWRPLAWTGPKPATGLPAVARAARHALLAEAAREAGAAVLLLAHTADDVAEGEALRAQAAPTLGRLREWAPSPAWPEGRGVFLLRPLLAAGREELRAWLRTRRLAWLEDPANADPRFARARVRLAGVEPASAEADIPPGFGEATGDGRIRLRRARLAGDPAAGRILRAALACAAGAAAGPRGEVVGRLLARLGAAGGLAATAGGARLAGDAHTLEVGREPGRGGLPQTPLPDGDWIVWDGRFEVRASMPGWSVAAVAGRMASLDARDRERLRLAPAALRDGRPLFVRGGEARLGGGGLELRSLVPARFDAAIGRIADERTLRATTFH